MISATIGANEKRVYNLPDIVTSDPNSDSEFPGICSANEVSDRPNELRERINIRDFLALVGRHGCCHCRSVAKTVARLRVCLVGIASISAGAAPALPSRRFSRLCVTTEKEQ